jgi:cell division protein FtsA
MKQADVITVVDLGTTNIVAMVGRKNSFGAIQILAYETEPSEQCIKRGYVYNIEKTGGIVKRLILKLRNKTGYKIEQVYVGVGGQSLRSMNYTVSKILGEDAIVTEGILNDLERETREYQPELVDVLDIVSPEYNLDGQTLLDPLGLACNRIEANYKIIIGRPTLRKGIVNSILNHAKINIEGIIVSPLALADVVLTDEEKELGSAVINFGGGVTTLAVYKRGVLQGLSVIPFGSNLITRDLMSLHVSEKEAERLKNAFGKAMPEVEKETKVSITLDNGSISEKKLIDINYIVEARSREIIKNVYRQVEELGLQDELKAGVVISGGGSALKRLSEAVSDTFKTSVRSASLKNDIDLEGVIAFSNPLYSTAIALLVEAIGVDAREQSPIAELSFTEKEPVNTVVETKEDAKQDTPITVTKQPNTENIEKDPPKPRPKSSTESILTRIGKKIISVTDGASNTLFRDDDFREEKDDDSKRENNND